VELDGDKYQCILMQRIVGQEKQMYKYIDVTEEETIQKVEVIGVLQMDKEELLISCIFFMKLTVNNKVLIYALDVIVTQVVIFVNLI
jgi:hypothetical protein